MSKIPGSSAEHQTRRHTLRQTSHFERIARNPDGRHPVDVYVDSRVQDRVRRKWIIKLQDRIMKLMGPHARLFLKLESMVEQEGRYRERCYFDAGYNFGHSEAQDRANHGFRPQRDRAKSLLTQLLAQAEQEHLRRKEITLVLLQGIIELTEEHASFDDP